MTRLACTQHQQRRETTNSNEFGTETQSQYNFPNFYIFIKELNTLDNRGWWYYGFCRCLVRCQAESPSFFSLCSFVLIQKNQKIKDKRMLRRLSGQRTGEVEVVGLFIVGKGKVLDSAACYAGQRKALCSALKVVIVM